MVMKKKSMDEYIRERTESFRRAELAAIEQGNYAESQDHKKVMEGYRKSAQKHFKDKIDISYLD